MNIETGVAIWNAAVEACSTVAENCEPDDHGYLNIQEIAETIRMKCSVFTDGASKMTEQRMIPVELLEEIWRDIGIHTDATCSSIGRGVLNDLRAIIDGPEVEPVAEWVKADCGNYPILRWRGNYVASIGDKFYLSAPAAPAVPDGSTQP